MSNITCNLRYPGKLNCGLKKLALNLIPFPRLHYLITSYFPYNDKNKYHSVFEISDQIFRNNIMC